MDLNRRDLMTGTAALAAAAALPLPAASEFDRLFGNLLEQALPMAPELPLPDCTCVDWWNCCEMQALDQWLPGKEGPKVRHRF